MQLTRLQQVGVVSAIACIAAAVGVGIHGRVRAPEPDENAAAVYTPPPTPAAPSTVVVHVTGAVARPGVCRVPRGSRVEQAVEAAGGFAPGAAADAINLAEPVADGQQLEVPYAGRAAVPSPTAPAAPVDLNTATAQDLEALPEIGPERAREIVAYRTQNGPLQRVDDLLNVPGIGEKTLERVRPYVFVR